MGTGRGERKDAPDAGKPVRRGALEEADLSALPYGAPGRDPSPGNLAAAPPENRTLHPRGPISTESLGRHADDCRTPVQFRTLLEQLKSVVPYRHLACGIGASPRYRIRQVVDVDYPRKFLQWYLATGMLRRDPLFREWLRTQRPQEWLRLAQRHPERFDPEHLEKAESFGLQYTIAGGSRHERLIAYFSLAMHSADECGLYLEALAGLLPALCRAFVRSHQRPSLTDRKRTILYLTSLGDSRKQIGDKLGISERTVKMHLEDTKRKLYADNITSAVVIALRTGLIEQ